MDKTLIHCPSAHGHYGTYVKYLLDYVAYAELDPNKLLLVLPREFPDKRGDVVTQANDLGVVIRYYTPRRTRYPKVDMLVGPLKDWQVGCAHAEAWNARRLIFLNLDALVQLKVPFTRRLPFRVSGILYRPFPHYGTFPTTQLSTALELKRTRQELVLTWACRSPALETLYWLDPHAAEYMNEKANPRSTWLPDPVELETPDDHDVRQARQTLRVTASEQLWLVFGADIVRKGTREILRALPTGAYAKNVTLALVGPVYPGQGKPLLHEVEQARKQFAGRIVVHDEFVPERSVPAYFAAASLVLTLYQHHMGSSGAFVRAAAAGKPILSTDFGLLGHLVHTHRLGFTCNVDHDISLRNSLRLAALGALSEAFDPRTALAFAQRHHKFGFADTLLGTRRRPHLALHTRGVNC
jgi:hypothetical protein